MTQQLENLERYLKPKGLTISNLADEIKVSRSTFTHIKNGNKEISANLLGKILKKFPDLDPDWLNGKVQSPYKKLNQNVVAEEGPVYNPRKPQEGYQMQSIDHEFLLAITKQLEVKDDQIRTLTKIIENITTK